MNFFKKIYENIKKIFIKKETIKEFIVEHEEIILKDEITDTSLLSEIKIGDVIWAKRYKTEEGHREGPYIVVATNKDGLICSKGTSTEIKDDKQDVYFTLNNDNFILEKDTNFRLHNFELIDNSTFIKKIGSLEKNEFSKFMKSLKMGIKFNKHIEEENDFILPLDSSDIIIIGNKKYIVLETNYKKFRCIPFENYKEELEMIDFKNLDYSKVIEFDKNTKYKIIDKINNNVLIYLLKKEKEYVENILNQKIIQRGSVVSNENKLYYIYGEEGQDWLAFEIKVFKEKNDIEINVNARRYYTNFKDLKMKKSPKIIPVFFCSEDEIKNVKKERKSYKENEKKEEEYKNTPHLRLNVGDIIESKNLKNRRFIIISVKPRTYECLSINKLKQGIYESLLIRKEDSIISKNKSLNGIKWLEENTNFKLDKIGNDRIIEQILNRQLKYIEKTNLETKKEELKTEFIENNEACKIKPGMIVKRGEFSDETFIVKGIIGNLVECISCLDKNNSKKQSHFFNKDEIIIVEKQKRK